MFSAIRTWFARSRTTAPRRVVLGIECLEDRCTPTAIVVTTLDDIDPTPEQLTQGIRSLRWAIAEANASDDNSNSITFQQGTSGVLSLLSPLAPITKNISIDGDAGSGAIIVQRDSSAPPCRVFTVQGAVEFDLSNLTVTGGETDRGGGIFVSQGATVNLYQVFVDENVVTGRGGGIYNLGTLTVENSSIYYNAAHRGGGIYNDGEGTLNMQFSAVWHNSAVREGGGIYNNQGCSAVVVESSIKLNWAGDAAAVFPAGSGGGIYNRGTLQMSDSKLWENGTFASGGGIYCDTGSSTSFTSVTIIGNCAAGQATSSGGGFWRDQLSNLFLTNCELSGNSAADGISHGGYVLNRTAQNYSWTGAQADDVIIFAPLV